MSHSNSGAIKVAPDFFMHHADLPSLPWQEQRSPAGKFHSFCRNVSLALGGVRNAGPTHGGHPFDLELVKLGPGECGYPLHSHAAQWELFLILEGTGTVRTTAGTTPVAVGDALLHPPAEAHQLTHPGDADLLYLLIADNPPVDFFHYPDSDKWGFRAPRKCFRATDSGYWDGEE